MYLGTATIESANAMREHVADTQIMEARQRAQRRAAAHVLRKETAPSINGKIPRLYRRKPKPARPQWDDSIAGKSLPRSAISTATIHKSTSRIHAGTTNLTDRADGSPTITRTVQSIFCKRPVAGGKSESLTKSVATSPIREVTEPAALSTSNSLASLRDSREADALEKLEQYLTDLETIEDMIRLQIGDVESACDEEEHSGIGREQCARSSDHIDTAATAFSSEPYFVSTLLDNEDGDDDRYRRRRIVEKPFERTVIEKAVEAIIDDEIQRLAHELDSVKCA